MKMGSARIGNQRDSHASTHILPGIILTPLPAPQQLLIFENCGKEPSPHIRKMAPIFLPRKLLADRIVSVSSTIAQTPRALAMYGPSPSR